MGDPDPDEFPAKIPFRLEMNNLMCIGSPCLSKRIPLTRSFYEDFLHRTDPIAILLQPDLFLKIEQDLIPRLLLLLGNIGKEEYST